VSALWLGPDEWLIVGADPPATVPEGGGIVDVSAQRTTFVLSGPRGPELLAFGCALDLSRLTIDRCAQTMLARANVVLWASDVDELRVLVRPSFARYLVAWFTDAATEFDPVTL
jgi:sarcosine oxidase, subunit gamma